MYPVEGHSSPEAVGILLEQAGKAAKSPPSLSIDLTHRLESPGQYIWIYMDLYHTHVFSTKHVMCVNLWREVHLIDVSLKSVCL